MPSGFAYDGRTRFIWLDDNPADLDSPTLVEIAAGVDVSGYLVPESFNPGTGDSRVDTRDALSSFDSQAIGRFQAAPSAMFKSRLADTFEGDDDLAWTTFKDRLTQGCILFFEDIDEGSDVTTNDVCDVYPSCQTGQPQRQQTALNTERRFKVEFAVGDHPHLGAVVVAS